MWRIPKHRFDMPNRVKSLATSYGFDCVPSSCIIFSQSKQIKVLYWIKSQKLPPVSLNNISKIQKPTVSGDLSQLTGDTVDFQFNSVWMCISACMCSVKWKPLSLKCGRNWMANSLQELSAIVHFRFKIILF